MLAPSEDRAVPALFEVIVIVIVIFILQQHENIYKHN